MADHRLDGTTSKRDLQGRDTAFKGHSMTLSPTDESGTSRTGVRNMP